MPRSSHAPGSTRAMQAQATVHPALRRRREYRKLVDEIGSLLEDGRRSVVRHVNATLVETYWHIGQRIVQFEQSGKERANYGEMLILNLSMDLTALHGKGFDERNLRHMRKFYMLYRKRYTVCTESEMEGTRSSGHLLAWSHYRLLIAIEGAEKRAFYESECKRNGWSVRQLSRQLDCMLFERSRLSKNRDAVLVRANKENAPLTPEDEIKDPYILDFLDLKDNYSESELEDALIRHLQDFLLELGAGFSFGGRQTTIHVGNQRFKVDLVLYHMGLHCLVLMDLKVGAFSHADAGQMNFHLNYFREKVANPMDNPPVGIIMCTDKDDAVVKYALGGIRNRIFASRYRLELPDEKVLSAEILRGKERFMERRARMGRSEVNH